MGVVNFETVSKTIGRRTLNTAADGDDALADNRDVVNEWWLKWLSWA